MLLKCRCSRRGGSLCPNEEIASSTACQIDVTDFFNEYAGWCDYAADTHRQWKVVLSGELEFETIKDLPMLILPSALSLTDANFQALEKYLKSGGRVLATGKTGLRFGPDGHLYVASRGTDSVKRCTPSRASSR